MNIAPLSFKGMNNIRAFANQQGKLTNQEKELMKKAEEYHSIEIIPASDGDWCMSRDMKTADEFAKALAKFEKSPSKFAFLVGIDTLKDSERAKVTQIDDSVKNTTLNLAKSCDDVSKNDVIKHLNILS